MMKDMFKGMMGGLGGNKPEEQGPTYDEDLVAMVDKKYIERQTERQLFEMQWRLAGEFLDSNQYLEINPLTLSLEEIPKLFWYSEREVFNQIATITETRISKLSRQRPMMKTRPASSDDIDISTSRVTSMLLSSAWHDQKMDSKYEDFVSWLELTGTCFWKVTWNTNKGRTIYEGPPLDQQQQPGMIEPPPQPVSQEGATMDPQMQPEQPPAPVNPLQREEAPPTIAGQQEGSVSGQQDYMIIKEGDIDTELCPPYEVYPDSSYRSGVDACRDMIHARAHHIEEIFDTYNIRVEAEDVDVMSLQKSTVSTRSHGLSRSSPMKLKEHAIVKEYYKVPCREYPQGRMITICNKKLLYNGPLPYKIGDNGEYAIPLIRCVSINRPGCFWGKSVIDRCIPVQRRYNAWRNRKAEYMNLVTIGQWTAPIGSLEEGTELNNEPGNIIWYNETVAGSKPAPVEYPSLPSSFEMEGQTLLAEFTSISGVSELSRYAEAPEGVKSGVALGITKEQDDTRISTSVTRIANSAVELGKFWIRMYRQFSETPRTLRFYGANREADVREWEKSDLSSDDVFIENMAALAETPSQRRQMVFDLLKSGLFDRPELSRLDAEGKQKVFQLLEFGHWETGDEDDNTLHKSRARTENRRMMDGIQVQVMDFDDHMIHVEQHNRQRMQSEWDELLRTPAGAILNEQMMAHIAVHIQLALKAMPKEAPPPQPPGAGNEKPAKEAEAQ